MRIMSSGKAGLGFVAFIVVCTMWGVAHSQPFPAFVCNHIQIVEKPCLPGFTCEELYGEFDCYEEVDEDGEPIHVGEYPEDAKQCDLGGTLRPGNVYCGTNYEDPEEQLCYVIYQCYWDSGLMRCVPLEYEVHGVWVAVPKYLECVDLNPLPPPPPPPPQPNVSSAEELRKSQLTIGTVRVLR